MSEAGGPRRGDEGIRGETWVEGGGVPLSSTRMADEVWRGLGTGRGRGGWPIRGAYVVAVDAGRGKGCAARATRAGRHGRWRAVRRCVRRPSAAAAVASCSSCGGRRLGAGPAGSAPRPPSPVAAVVARRRWWRPRRRRRPPTYCLPPSLFSTATPPHPATHLQQPAFSPLPTPLPLFLHPPLPTHTPRLHPVPPLRRRQDDGCPYACRRRRGGGRADDGGGGRGGT